MSTLISLGVLIWSFFILGIEATKISQIDYYSQELPEVKQILNQFVILNTFWIYLEVLSVLGFSCFSKIQLQWQLAFWTFLLHHRTNINMLLMWGYSLLNITMLWDQNCQAKQNCTFGAYINTRTRDKISPVTWENHTSPSLTMLRSRHLKKAHS